MTKDRTLRLNSLLKEVITEVIRKDVRNPHVNELVAVTKVDITKDLRHAKVYISVIGNEVQKRETIDALQSASGFIAVNSSKKVRMRFFPELKFILDDSVEKHMHIDNILKDIHAEQSTRTPKDESTE
jgi:ribosome-binding factor A